jgi:hypothetical protein
LSFSRRYSAVRLLLFHSETFASDLSVLLNS